MQGKRPQKRFRRNDESKKQMVEMKREKKGLPQDIEPRKPKLIGYRDELIDEEVDSESSSTIKEQVQQNLQQAPPMTLSSQTLFFDPTSYNRMVHNQFEPIQTSNISMRQLVSSRQRENYDYNDENNERRSQKSDLSPMSPSYNSGDPLEGFEVPSSYYEKLQYQQQKQDQLISKPKHRGFYKGGAPSQVNQQKTPSTILIPKPRPPIPSFTEKSPQILKKNQNENADLENAPQKKIVKVVSFGQSDSSSSDYYSFGNNTREPEDKNLNIQVQLKTNLQIPTNPPIQQSLGSRQLDPSNPSFISQHLTQTSFFYPSHILQEEQLKQQLNAIKEMLSQLPFYHDQFPISKLPLKSLPSLRNYLLNTLKTFNIISNTVKFIKNRQSSLEETMKVLPDTIIRKTDSLKNYFKDCIQTKNTLFQSEKLIRIVENQKNLFKDVILPQPGRPQCLFKNPDEGTVLMIKWIQNKWVELDSFFQEVCASLNSSEKSSFLEIIKSQVQYLQRNASKMMNLKLKIQTIKGILSKSRSMRVDSLFKQKILKQMSQSDWYYYNLLKQCESIMQSIKRKREIS